MCGQDKNTTVESKDAKQKVHWGVTIGTCMMFLSTLGASVTFPFLQAQRDNFGCDALCYGYMQSARSGLTLIGQILVGRMSDRLGRSTALWVGIIASLVSYSINWTGTTISAMWLSMIPSALLNQNFSVLKALFADYNTDEGGSESDRASAMGRLGMAVGFSFMLGPALGNKLLAGYSQAIAFAFCMTVLSGCSLILLPEPLRKDKPVSESSGFASLVSFVSLPAARTPGAKLLFFMRCMMALAFNIFMTVWTVSLKHRFDFGPGDHAYFMGWIGLCYAVSQGFVAKALIQRSGEDPTAVLLLCVVALSIGRLLAMLTTSLVLVYAIMAGVIVALGVMNTALASACSRLADQDQIGGLFGVMEALESLAGLVGPTLGGLLFKAHPHLPIISVILIYAAVFVAILLFYRSTVVNYRVSSVATMVASETDKGAACKATPQDSTDSVGDSTTRVAGVGCAPTEENKKTQ